MDYLIVDREHGAHSDELTAEVCAIGRRMEFPVLIRPIDGDYSTIRKAIDLGPCGLLLPSVESAAALDAVRSAIYLPPRGSRRPGGAGNFWVGSYDYQTWRQTVEDAFIVLPQIETKHGLDLVDEIAAHEITTAMAIGPYDLSVDLGISGELEHETLIAAETNIREAAAKAGKSMWVIGDPAPLISRGHSFLCIGESTSMFEHALRVAGMAAREARKKVRGEAESHMSVAG